MWEPKSNKNKILILQKCAFGLMFFGNFYEQTITDQSTLIVNSSSLKNKDWERGRLNREGG